MENGDIWIMQGSSPSWIGSPFFIGIILLIVVTFVTIFKRIKNRKKLSKKWIIVFVILTFLIPVWKVNYYSGGCFGKRIVYYKNIYTITILKK